MKRIVSLALLLLAFFGSAQISRAQDVIVKKDASTILAKILSISETEIEYKKWDNQDGPTFKISIGSVMSVTYQNGTTDTFNKPAAKQSTPSPAASPITSGEVLKIFADGNEIHDAYTGREISSAELKQLMDKNLYSHYENAREYYRKAKFSSIVGVVVSGIGVALLTTALVLPKDEKGELSNGAIACYILTGSCAVGALYAFAVEGGQNRRAAQEEMEGVVNRYNKKRNVSQTTLSIGPTNYGFGLAFRF